MGDQSEVDGCIIAKLSIVLTSGVRASACFDYIHKFHARTRQFACNVRVQRSVGVDAPAMVASI
jgi:hypothetical protein